jgi:hypothetical protein
MMAESDPTPAVSSVLLQLLKLRYGDRLEPEAWEEVRKSVEGLAESTARLRSVTLEPGGDEPMTRFVPYRGEG